MLTMQIVHDLGKGRERVARLLRLAGDKGALHAVVETGAALVVRRHLTDNYAGKVNGLGGASTGYWRTAIEGTTSRSDASGATVSINQKGVRLKYEGGVIKASGRTSEVTGKPIRFLSIPVHPAAHGKSIADFGQDATYLRPFAAGGGLTEGGDGAGAGVFRKRGSQPAAGDPLYYVLKKFVRIKADKNILPPESEVAAEVSRGLDAYFSE